MDIPIYLLHLSQINTIKNMPTPIKKPSTHYRFKNEKVHKAFKQLALDNNTTLQNLITEALENKYKQIQQ